MQCAHRLKPERAATKDERPGAREIAAGALDIVAADDGPDDSGLASAFAVGDKKVSWSCVRCGTLNDVRADVCTNCEASFMDLARNIATFEVNKKKSRATLRAFGYLLGGAVVMRSVAGLVSPWAAAALLGGTALRTVVKYLRAP